MMDGVNAVNHISLDMLLCVYAPKVNMGQFFQEEKRVSVSLRLPLMGTKRLNLNHEKTDLSIYFVVYYPFALLPPIISSPPILSVSLPLPCLAPSLSFCLYYHLLSLSPSLPLCSSS